MAVKNDPDLGIALRGAGLNENLWLPILAKFGVTSKAALDLQQGDTNFLSMLQKEARYTYEKDALKKILKIDDIRETGKIKPKVRPKPDKNSISKLESSFEKGPATLQKRGWLEEATLLQKVSGGRALQGTLLTSNLEDQLEARACLLKLPGNVSIVKDPSPKPVKEVIISFSNEHWEERYKSTVNILGHSAAQAPAYGRSVDVNVRCKKTITKNTVEYSSTMKYSSMHVATYTFGYGDLRLSDNARKDLKKLINTVKTASKAIVQRACENFFRTYGSHVYQGPLHFGGNFWRICSSNGFHTEETNTVKELQTEAVTVTAGSVAEFGAVSCESVKAKFKGNCTASTLASTRMVLELDGGPTEVSDLAAWKAELVANNSTWILTDRGGKLVAVWDVIGRNHQQEFGQVRDMLRKAWEEMTGLPSEPDILPDLNHSSVQSSIVMSEENPAAHTLFSNLGLSDHYHDKLGLQDALCIRSEPLKMSLKMSNPTEPRQLPLLILQKLMSFDDKCRSDLMESSHTSKSADASVKIHPVDGLLALILCSDPFLQQDLFSRLAKCQLAVPFILPDPFTKELILPLWAMRSITKEWKCQQGEVEKTSSIIKYPMPIVSFLRLGKHQRRGESKSRILNRVISESEHFFSCDLPGGMSKHVLGEGLVDMCWYLPAGTSNDIFPDAVTFLNLHGDARKHPRQSKFLSQMSSMCFVLLTEEGLVFDKTTIETLKRFSSSVGGVVLLNDSDEIPEALKSLATISLEHMNAVGIAKKIQQQLDLKLFAHAGMQFKTIEFKTIEQCCNVDLAQESEIHLDECNILFQEGQEHAKSVSSLVVGRSNAKEVMLPLQGEKLWRAWGDHNKELHRLQYKGEKGVHEYTAMIRAEKTLIRHQQLEFVKALSPLTKRFIASLLALEGPSNRTARNVFLQCLKLNLYSLSEECISRLLKQYQATQVEISAESKLKVKKEKIKQLRKKLEGLKNDIVRASFNLHHLFRELGQVYEASQGSKYGEKFSRLPKVAAELLLDGYPLEVMDGDAAHVPVKWVQAVIKEVAERLDDPQLFVLSVLGVQSTGKSTMLNTVFGLQFNVSAGRCTRGAFMQLLPVDETIKATTNYSYVLVIDTEGVRTPELDSSEAHKHDNELATFIIGLANATFINIYGEVAGDLDDILQTTVHAFLRMKEVKYYDRSCQFIHQNSGANAKGQVGRDNFSKQLDRWTRDAAKEENCDGQYKKFSDVIQFDDQTDVHHFPCLWKGDPPMAPVNQGYSHAAQGMKLNLIQMLHAEAKSTNVSSFNRKVSDLWKALLQENFVFSFRNTEEITAYNLLERKFNKWEGKMQAQMLNWEKKAANEINTEKNMEKIPAVVKEKQKELIIFLRGIYDHLKSEMQQFFSEHKLKGTLVQWKAKFERKLEHVKDYWEEHADEHCEKLGRSRQAMKSIEECQKEYTAMMKREAQKIITELKKEQDELDDSLEKRILNEAHLKKIMKQKHKLFSPEKLSRYKEDGLLTEEQCRSDLTERNLKHILCKVLTPEQAKSILKQGLLTEKELKAKFDESWNKLIKNHPPVYHEVIDVEKEVERKLTHHVKKFGGGVMEGLQRKQLRKWGTSLALVVDEKHYTTKQSSSWHGKNGNFLYSMYRKVVRITDPHQSEAQKITVQIFDEAKQYLETIKETRTNFNETYTLELLQKLDEVIEKKESTVAKHFTFTREYRIEVYLTACGYAVGQFEEMDKEFKEQNDPRLYMEKFQRVPLFTRFKNQYYKTAAEEAIADNLCALLGVSIKDQIESTLGAKIVGRMKSEAYLSNKMALKAKILIDLGTERNFGKYITYLTDVKQSIRDWIEYYTVEYCNEEVSGDGTRLQVLTKEEVSHKISFLGRKVSEVNEIVASKWLSIFCKDVEVRRELGVSLDANDLLIDHEMEALDLENFKGRMRSGLCTLQKKLNSSFDKFECDATKMSKWKHKPYSLLKTLCGCTEQCPFCGEQCDLGEHDGTTMKHTVAQHRPTCVIGYRDENTKVLVTDICPTEVSSINRFRNRDTDNEYHPYKEYLKIYPNWSIPPDPAAEESTYWKWFVGQYIDALAKVFDAKAPDPKETREWSHMNWQDVKTKLKSNFNL